MNKKICKGRSLVEVLGIFAIIAIFSAVVINMYKKQEDSVKRKKAEINLLELVDVIEKSIMSKDNFTVLEKAGDLNTYFKTRGVAEDLLTTPWGDEVEMNATKSSVSIKYNKLTSETCNYLQERLPDVVAECDNTSDNTSYVQYTLGVAFKPATTKIVQFIENVFTPYVSNYYVGKENTEDVREVFHDDWRGKYPHRAEMISQIEEMGGYFNHASGQRYCFAADKGAGYEEVCAFFTPSIKTSILCGDRYNNVCDAIAVSIYFAKPDNSVNLSDTCRNFNLPSGIKKLVHRCDMYVQFILDIGVN